MSYELVTTLILLNYYSQIDHFELGPEKRKNTKQFLYWGDLIWLFLCVKNIKNYQ